jgi:hypothetical protein
VAARVRVLNDFAWTDVAARLEGFYKNVHKKDVVV